MPDYFLGKVDQVIGPDQNFVMIGLVFLRNHARVRQLAECFGIALESYRIGLHRLVQELAHTRDDRARIEPPAQKRAERDIADEMQLDALSQ